MVSQEVDKEIPIKVTILPYCGFVGKFITKNLEEKYTNFWGDNDGYNDCVLITEDASLNLLLPRYSYLT